MVPTENGVYKDEIYEDVEMDEPKNGMRLMDYIPIYIPTIEEGLMEQGPHEKRFLDFLKARPSKDWFLKFGFVRRQNGSPTDEPPPSDPDPGLGRRRRFRVPFVRRINWGSLMRYFKKWIKNPANVALLIWLLIVAAGLIMLVLVMTGMLNSLIPGSTQRKKWEEVINQILNALFTIMCLYQHPNLFHHLVLLCRWRSSDKEEIRKVYCKDGASRPYEWVQMMFVVLLLHITCISQYVMCGLYWGYSRTNRPDWAVNVCIIVGIASPIIAGLYVMKSPLGRRYENRSEMDQESQQQVETTTTQPIRRQLSLYNRRVVVTQPEWIGGLFDCCDDPTVACWSFFCTFCVFGWNMERLGFGNMYVHIFTFLLFCVGPFLIFGASALNIDDETIAYAVVIVGVVLCMFGLVYGGIWRAEMRKKFKLPGNPLCCGFLWLADYMQWLFCWACSLAQEVRTGNFYEIEDDGFYRKVTGEDGKLVLLPLPREGESGGRSNLDYSLRSYSCPPKLGPPNPLVSSEEPNGFSFERASTFSKVHAMTPPLPPLIQLGEN